MSLSPPEEYNVLHIGPEGDHPLERLVVKEAKMSRVKKLSFSVTLGAVFFALLAVSASFHRSLERNQVQIASLIDEVGSLNQSNFELYAQLESQEAVLQSIGNDFTSLGEAMHGEDGTELQKTILSLFSKLRDLRDGEMSLTYGDVTVVADDATFDILLLGTNGAHTDTIMVASVNKEKEKVTLFSIPRDLYINGRRINEYYTYYGVDQLKRMVESVTGLEMDRYAQIDLAGFVEVVDIVGGVDVFVPESIYDGYYPNGKGGYTAYSIEKGQHHLDGEEALKYARSRKSTSDFDRAERQQLIVSALRTKMIQLDGVMDMKQITEIFQSGLEYSTTDITLLDLVSYYYDYQDYDLNQGLVLSSGNYLYSMINQSGAYILLPNTGNFDEIHKVISQLVN